jgi:DNA-binding SARP family transcriptional activator
MAIELIGGFRVRVRDQVIDEIDWPLRKPKALIKILSLAPGHRMHREQILDALWPELDVHAAGNNLRKALFHARAAVGGDANGSALIVSQGELISLAPGTWVDVDAFRSAVSAARITKDVDVYRDAITLCRGELLPEDRYEEWAVRRQSELRAEMVAVLIELAVILEARGELTEAAGVLRRAVALDPLSEEASGTLLGVLATAGQRSEALSVYEALRDALEREIGTEPSVEIISRYHEVVTRTDATPARTAQRWEHIGDLRMMAGDTAGAAQALGAARAAAEYDADVARLERKCAQALLMAHDAKTAGGHLDRAEVALERAPDASETVLVVAARATWSCEVGDFDAAAELADRACQMAQTIGDPSAIAAAYETMAIVCHYRGVWRDGLMLEIDRMGNDLDDVALARVFDIHHCIGQYHLYGDGLVDGVEDYARQVLQAAGRRSAKRAEAFGWCLLGEALMLRGRLDEAEACLTQSTALHSELGNSSAGLPWQRLGEVAASRGNLDAAQAAVTRGMAIATVSPMARHLWGRLYATSAFIAMRRGDAAAAVAAIRDAQSAAARYGDCPTCSALLHPMAAEAYAALGDAAGAARHAELAAGTASMFQSSAWSAMAESALGEASRAAGSTAAAARHFENAAMLYDKASHVFWAQRVRERAGNAPLV